MKMDYYISQLLYRYQCVTVPGFGAFLTEIQSAQLHENSHSFYPPKKLVSFNGYLKNNEATVFTKSEKSWSKLFSQRVRWASKTPSYNGLFGKFLAIVVFAMNLNLIASFIFLPFVFCLLLLFVKISIDVILLYKTNKFIGQKNFSIPLLSAIFYPIFCVSVATYALFGKFEWKNRTFNA